MHSARWQIEKESSNSSWTTPSSRGTSSGPVTIFIVDKFVAFGIRHCIERRRYSHSLSKPEFNLESIYFFMSYKRSIIIKLRKQTLNIVEHFNVICQYDEYKCSYAAIGGHLNTLLLARENGCQWDQDGTFSIRFLLIYIDSKWG